MVVKDGDRILILVMPKTAILGRKNCTRCGRWRHLVDFPHEKRNNQLYIKSSCRACENQRRRDWYAEMTPGNRARHNRYSYVKRVEGMEANDLRRVDAWPIRRYLLEQVSAGRSVNELGAQLEIDPRYVLELALGYRKANSRLMPIRTVTASLVAHVQAHIRPQ